MLRPYEGSESSECALRVDDETAVDGETGGYEKSGQGTTGTACRALRGDRSTRTTNSNYGDYPDKRRTQRRLCCAHRAPLLEAFAAEDGAALRRTERHRRFFATLRASRLRFGTHRRGAAICAAPYAFRTLRLARLATLGLVLEALVGEKHLLAGSKHKLRIAF